MNVVSRCATNSDSTPRSDLAIDAAEPTVSAFPARDDERAVGSECTTQSGERRVAGDVEDQVVLLGTVGEVLVGCSR